MGNKKYVGKELELFAKATNWKRYYSGFLKPYIGNNVLDVGAGIGGTTKILCNGHQNSWTCLEPDIHQSKKIREMINKRELPKCCKSAHGTIKDIPKEQLFDTIIYVDVIEHIKDDAKELSMAIEHLSPGGFLIVVVPAHQLLYSPFDKSIGHYRRYNKKMLRSIVPKCLKEKKLIYLDSMGLALSASNKMFLKQDYPSEKQVIFWDKVIVGLSKFVDKFLNYSIGKEVVGIWENVK